MKQRIAVEPWSPVPPGAVSITLVPSWTGAGRWASADSLRFVADRLARCAVETVTESDAARPDARFDDYARRYGLDRVHAIADQLSRRVLGHLRSGILPIAIGGDHTLTIGGFSALRRALGPGARIGLIWVDAHADLNTHETTETHNCHGMPLAALLGLGHPALVHAGGLRGAKLGFAEVALIGLRSVDPPERALLARHPELLTIAAGDIRARGLEAAIARLLAWGKPLDAVYLSFDLDSIRPSDAPGVTTPVPGAGLSRDEALTLVARLAAGLPVVAADFVEYWPERDAGFKTVRLLHDLVDSVPRAKMAWRSRRA
ncbi:MAG TPA: arginase family protein [Kofleriaceae bacterium]|nr:arginase family protein [Kofleriaceae bacterium]